ncbi:MAG TPA: nuclear transport factor 2 family protein [Hyphomicrobium sp.]|nr:nuclear transport factor 2 family protein [Hyphomicrobium sp.]
MTTSQPDLAAVFDAHVAAEFTTRDLDATMATMTATPHLTHVPVMTGGQGREEVASFYGSYFICHWPADLTITPVSRTVGSDCVVDEVVLTFTHDIEMPAILPGVAPTGRRVEAAFCVLVGFKDGKVAHEHIYWDQASILLQIGLLDPGLLPVTGVEQARRILAPAQVPANALIRAAEARRRTAPR